ncbi:hypothetical protein ABZ345_20475 [Lentzea sp. NPDC005914]|uniref:thermonuclease family protein n=1 Tax=Lentzea sp. NPDC005914 TaxID=3154572 RepID=UPI003400CF16
MNILEGRPAIVRLFWWRSSQSARLAMTCLGVVTAVATTGAVGFATEVLPQHHRSDGLEAAVHRGDSFEAVVHTVSEVDTFDGVEPATGLFFRARVAGLLRTGCRPAESREAAQNLLRGRNVRLMVRKDGGFDSDLMTVDVVLPDGTDYAHTIVHDGVAPADLTARDDLAVADSEARQERRGLWAVSCATNEQVTASAAPSEPSSFAPTLTTTTTAATTTTEPAPSSSEVTPTSAPSRGGSWLDVLLGRQCYVEGARRTSANGDEMVCERTGRDQLRWRRVH